MTPKYAATISYDLDDARARYRDAVQETAEPTLPSLAPPKIDTGVEIEELSCFAINLCRYIQKTITEEFNDENNM